jgi:hypothetical protein
MHSQSVEVQDRLLVLSLRALGNFLYLAEQNSLQYSDVKNTPI